MLVNIGQIEDKILLNRVQYQRFRSLKIQKIKKGLRLKKALVGENFTKI